MSDALSLCRTAALWGFRFYRDHFWLVLGLSLIPTVQRFLVVEYKPSLWISISTEVLVTFVRLALVVVIVRGLLAEVGRHDAWARLRRGITARRTAFLLQWVILAIAFVIFDVVPNLLISSPFVTAVLVAVKNPTVIAFTLLWMAGIAYGLMGYPQANTVALTRTRGSTTV